MSFFLFSDVAPPVCELMMMFVLLSLMSSPVGVFSVCVSARLLPHKHDNANSTYPAKT